jgi:NADH-quinone oxidoreductase subunit J
MIAALAFYVFAAILLISAGMVVSARNPVHAVLFLILAFFNAAALFLLAGAEFLAMILVIVYVGAVAVLFLFVVMMLDVNFTQMREGFQRYLAVGTAVGVVLLAELGMVLSGWSFAPASASLRLAPMAADVNNTAQLGRLIYTDYILLFQVSGLVLLVAMIGAIVLTLRDKKSSRRQVIATQIARTASDTLAMMDVRTGAGVKELGILRPKPIEPAVDPHADDHAPAGHGAVDHAHGGHH